MNYLDWAATAIPQEEIIIEANKKACQFFANPSAKHTEGKRARQALENSRQNIADLLSVQPDKIFFTSGGTEANHIPLLAMLNIKTQFSIAISSIEHSSIREQAKILEKNSFQILKIPVDNNGIITPEAVIKTIQPNTVLVAVMTVNNETGAIQPIKEIAEAIRNYSQNKKPIFFHSDTVQAIGKIPLNFSDMQIDSASFSGHKIGAPRGIGLLYLGKNIETFIRGGGQESNIRPGTENLAGVFAMEEALKNYILNQQEYLEKAKMLMSFLISELKKIKGIAFIPEIREQHQDNFSPWILQFATETLPGEVLQRCLSDKNIYLSTGAACSSKHKTNPIIQVMKIDPKLQKNIVRVSIGHTTKLNDIQEFLFNLKEILAEF